VGKNLGAEIATLRKGGDAIGGAVCQGLNYQGGLPAAGSDETAAVAHEQVLYVMLAVVRIDDGSFRISAHAASAEQVHGKLLFVYGQRPLLLGTSAVEDFECAVIEWDPDGR
jgi:hypothetical protein